MNHTKGEWKIEDGTQVVVGNRLIANTGGYTTNYKETRTENEANAQLIAASPRMIEFIHNEATLGNQSAIDFIMTLDSSLQL
jgi:hypothetical protein